MERNVCKDCGREFEHGQDGFCSVCLDEYVFSGAPCDWDGSGCVEPPKRRRGRPAGSKKPNSYVYRTIGLTPDQWEWLAQWHSSDSPSDQVRSLLDRAMRFWPAGPAKFR